MIAHSRWWWIGMVSIGIHIGVLFGVSLTKAPTASVLEPSMLSVQLLGSEDVSVATTPLGGETRKATMSSDGLPNANRSDSRLVSETESRSDIAPVNSVQNQATVERAELHQGDGGGHRHEGERVNGGVGNQVSPPTYGQNPRPPYPEIARRRGYEGLVRLRVWVLKTGKVGTIQLVGSSGYSSLDQSATNAVMNWVFNPARSTEGAIDGWVMIPIRFSLTQG